MISRPGSLALLFLVWGLSPTQAEHAAAPSEHEAAPEPAAVAPAHGEHAAAHQSGSEHEPEHTPAHKTEGSESHSALSESAHGETHESAPAGLSLDSKEVESTLRIGETKTAEGDYAAAEIAYRQILTAQATPEQDRDALLGLARMYRKKTELTRAAAVYEKILKEYPSDSLLPTVYLELGRTHRALGAYRLAIARFYSVINATLKLPQEGGTSYKQLARTAQFEVAETHFMSGDYAEAARFYSRLKLLDLAPADRARAHFKSVYALTLTGDHEAAVNGIRSFLEIHSDDENAPEARFLLSVSLRRLGRNQESLAAALELLKSEQGHTSSDSKRWVYWQRKTGNQLANEFYEQGDFLSALQIYQSLAALTPEPVWQLPVLYQIGLCLERQRQPERACESYNSILKQVQELDAATTKRSEFADLVTMASWRLKHLDWREATDTQLTTLIPPVAASPAPAPPTPPTPSS